MPGDICVKRLNNLFCSFILVSLMFTSCAGSGPPVSGASGGGVGLGDFLTDATRAGVLIAVINTLYKSNRKNEACALGVLVFFSELHKQNAAFLNAVTEFIKSPWVLTRKKMERAFCGGESLAWNEIVTSRNRIMKLLSPLTKQTSVVDLSREKRLRIIDQEDTKEAILDEQWQEYVCHIQSQCIFMSKKLGKNLNYYETQAKKTRKRTCNCVACIADKYVINPPVRLIADAGKACLRTSVKQTEEIAFYLKEIQMYLKEIINYSKSVTQLPDLDKERIKRLMNSTCDALEHLATLVDVGTAAAPASSNPVGQLPIKREASSSGYGGYGGYGSYGANA